jgi:hypothetical protein
MSHQTPEELIKKFEKAIVDGDIPVMAEMIGELHAQWNNISSERQSDILKLEAIFLSMLNARMKAKAEGGS